MVALVETTEGLVEASEDLGDASEDMEGRAMEMAALDKEKEVVAIKAWLCQCLCIDIKKKKNYLFFPRCLFFTKN